METPKPWMEYAHDALWSNELQKQDRQAMNEGLKKALDNFYEALSKQPPRKLVHKFAKESRMTEPRWFKLSEQKPENNQEVIIKVNQSWKDKSYKIVCAEFINADDPDIMQFVCNSGGEPFEIGQVTHWLEIPPLPKEEKPVDPIHQVAQNIRENHQKIIDDWCKAYLAEIYQKGMDIKPGCFTLVEQLDLVLENGKIGKKYWFELKKDKPIEEEKSVDPDWEEFERAYNNSSNYEIVDAIFEFLKAKYGK